jgi:hypothetical protein
VRDPTLVTVGRGFPKRSAWGPCADRQCGHIVLTSKPAESRRRLFFAETPGAARSLFRRGLFQPLCVPCHLKTCQQLDITRCGVNARFLGTGGFGRRSELRPLRSKLIAGLFFVSRAFLDRFQRIAFLLTTSRNIKNRNVLHCYRHQLRCEDQDRKWNQPVRHAWLAWRSLLRISSNRGSNTSDKSN